MKYLGEMSKDVIRKSNLYPYACAIILLRVLYEVHVEQVPVKLQVYKQNK